MERDADIDQLLFILIAEKIEYILHQRTILFAVK